MNTLPSGTVTFLFTDLEGSTKLWEANPAAMQAVIARHDALAASLVAEYEGTLVKSRGEGDSLFVVFARATDAASYACALQRALVAEPWPRGISLRVRMALHTGEADLREGDYFGPAVNRCARLRAAAHGGQVLLSGATQELVQDSLPDGASLRDLGQHRLRDLARPEHIFQLLHPDLAADFALLRSLDELPNNLPQQVTSFVGREKEIAEVKGLLGKTRLLTLTGSGGTGKTRLSYQVAADLLEEYAQGVWLAELAALTDPALVPQTVATVLGVKEEPGRPLTQTLVETLKPRQLLLLLDNCEHLLSACATLADAILRNCPHVRILASSREGLNIAGETTYRLPPLSLPDLRQLPPLERLTQYEAVQLFVERATLSVPAFTVTNQNVPAVAQVCHRLDGIPLAIELAAARVRSLSPDEINAHLSNRFRLLTGGSRTALPRHQTLRALIDWSYHLLTEPERLLLCRLSVFAGGWTLTAAEAVCAGEGIEDWKVLDLLTSLADKSLVFSEEREGTTRYRLLETVRQYGAEKLLEVGEGETVRGRHLNYFLALAEDAKPNLEGPEQARWLDVLETEYDNLRQAITFCLEPPGEAQKGLRLGGALHGFWFTRGYLREGRERLAALVSPLLAQERTAARARALCGAGVIAMHLHEFAAAHALAEESLAIFRELVDKQGIADATNVLAQLNHWQGNFAVTPTLLEQNLTICREIGHKWGIAVVLFLLAEVARSQGNGAAARARFEESRATFRELGNKGGIAACLGSLGRIAFAQGEHAAAQLLFEESLALYRELGSKSGIAGNFLDLGNVAYDRGDYTTARFVYGQSLALFRETGNYPGTNISLHKLIKVAIQQGNHAEARALSDQGAALARQNGDPGLLIMAGELARQTGECDRAAGLYQEALTLYRNQDNRPGTVMALHNLGHAELRLGQVLSARARFVEGLRLAEVGGGRRSVAQCVAGLGAAEVAGGRPERAARLLGAAGARLGGSGTDLDEVDQAEWERAEAAGVAALGREGFDAAFAEGQAMIWEQAVAFALDSA